MGCNAPLNYDTYCDGDCENCEYWDGKYDDEEDDEEVNEQIREFPLSF
jgi:2-iminoacetate synthase ThiH